jgi:hypothetical protein
MRRLKGEKWYRVRVKLKPVAEVLEATRIKMRK